MTGPHDPRRVRPMVFPDARPAAAADGPEALTGEAERRWAYEQTQPYALHGDGQVCRCAVKLRVETLARGLNRPELWEDSPKTR